MQGFPNLFKSRRWPPAVLGVLLLFLSAVAQAQPQGGTPVSFNSADGTGATIALRGVLYTPEGPPKGSVVLVHGSGGWSDYREGHYGRALSRAGYAVLAIDTFGPRGISSTVEDQSKLSSLQNTRDAFAARRYLVGQGRAADRMVVMGFSRGGVVALFAADRTFLPEEKERFAIAIPLYPACMARPREPKPASIVFMGLGEKDDYVGVKPCQELAAEFAAAGGKIDVKVYPGAAHAFDGNPANTRLYRLSDAENYSDCTVRIEPDGRPSYGGKTYAAADPSLMSDIRKTCMKKGASIWSNPAQKEAATRDVIEFLDARLAK